ncbi:hypothetical protein [Thermoflavimicrobium daqui]|uniref:Uncharacterized protein n=1 Tax=Thermoflavimicrobium daqui TaxID=2137476 RepID=A0A364K661_9BACL|nr:hypothetical protein [Thermoflavimicrobium daqui]RAL25758.1 hypothetical protein DL897_06695 [Thermoflavimicrobium daqui]
MNLNKMEDWEKEVENINWKSMLQDIDEALLDNLAVEIGFRTYEQLEDASEIVVDDYYICHLSDGRWVWWNPKEYAIKDPEYFHSKDEIKAYIADFLQLDQDRIMQLKEGLDQVRQSRKCLFCEYEFDLNDEKRKSWLEKFVDHYQFCSEECAHEKINMKVTE